MLDFDAIKEKVLPVLEKNKVLKAVLIGSFSEGTATKKSDIDIMIVMDTNERFFDRFDQFTDIYEALKGFAVELLIYTPQELKEISHRKFIQKILTKGRVIYECG